jgi:hypothetical protein
MRQPRIDRYSSSYRRVEHVSHVARQGICVGSALRDKEELILNMREEAIEEVTVVVIEVDTEVVIGVLTTEARTR